MRKLTYLMFALACLSATFVGCSSDKSDDNPDNAETVAIVALNPADGATNIASGTSVYVEFNQSPTVNFTTGSATVNGNKVDFQKLGKQLIITGFDIEQGQTYNVVVAKGTVANYDKEISWSFSGIEDKTAPTFVSSSIHDGASSVYSKQVLKLTFSENVKIVNPQGITLNGAAVEATVEGQVLVINATFEKNSTYKFAVAEGSITDIANNSASALSISFSTGDDKISTNCLNSSNATTQKLYKFLLDNYGSKIISGSMANVSVEQKEAALVKAATGKTPAMQTFDFCFVTLTSERSTWEQNSIYQDITYYQDLWNKGGIVSACWHLNVPRQEADAAKNDVNNNSTSWNAKIYFSAVNAVSEGTWENDFLVFAFDKAVEILTKYKEAGIPIVWRPFHEGSGNATITGNNSDAWFWWGKDGAEAYKNLWIYMFNYFKNKGLDNLIWVWTTQVGVGSDGAESWCTSDDSQWYPGDEYVDIIARDNYNKSKVSSSVEEFEMISSLWPTKMITLGENGGIANISEIFASGGTFSYFMPWYTYDLTDLNKSEHADKSWWQDAANCSDVLFLEDMTSW